MKTRLRVAADSITACGDRGPLPFIALEHLESHTGQLVADTEFPDRIAPEAGAAAVEPGDVLFGKLRPYLAKVWRADRPVYASTELLCIRPHADMDSRWLAYVCASRPLVEWAVASSDGTKMPRTSWEKLSEYRAEIPPLPQQRAIADYLDAETARIDALIEKKRRMVELLEERFWATFLAATHAATRSETPLRRAVAFITDGPFGSAFTSSEYAVEGAVVVRLGNIGFAEYRDADQVFIPLHLYEQFPRCHVRQGDLLVAGLGDASNHAGRACVAPDLGPAMVKGKCFLVRVRVHVASPDYLAFVLSSPYGGNLISALGRGSTRTMINLDVLKGLRVPLPSIHEQQRIVVAATQGRARSGRLAKVVREQIDRLDERRQALITAAVTGELPVPGVAA